MSEFINQIKDYREKVINARIINESFIKKIFFWESKVVVEELFLDPDMVSIAIDCFILFNHYPNECKKAEDEYWSSLEKYVKEKFLHEDVEEEVFEDNWKKFNKNMRNKYKDKMVIRLID